jgi:predicted aspartyl protease
MRASLLACSLLAASRALAAGAPEPPPEAVLAALPFAPSREFNRVMVDLAPDGAKPFVMMLDTGASVSVITPRMARELGVRVRRTKDTPYRRATRLGRDLQFWVDTQSSDTASRTGWEYGLLGGEFLDDYVVEIDFPGKRVRFLDANEYAVPESVDAPAERVVPFERADTRILVPIRVGEREVRTLLDTGAPGTAVLSGKAAREAGIDIEKLPGFGSLGTVLGETEARLYEAPSLEFGGFALGPVALLVAPKGWFNMSPNDSVIGYDVLAPFVLRIDYPKKRLWLKRVETGPIRFEGADYALAKRTGAFMTEVPGALYVWAVLPDTPAAKLGLRVGDAIVSMETAEDRVTPPDVVLRRILEGKELLVARRQGDVVVDTLLPEEPVVPDGD